MIARFTKTVRRLIAAVRRTPKPLRYAALSGAVLAEVEAGRLIRTGDFLARVGGDDLPDGKQSWFGRHVKSAYIAATGAVPLRVWAQQRTTGKWIHVAVYSPNDPALRAGLASYKATRHLVAAPQLAEAAQTTFAAPLAPWELTAREEAAADERWWSDRYEHDTDTEPDEA